MLDTRSGMAPPHEATFEHNRLFRGLSQDALERIRSVVEPVSFRADEVIFDEGDPTGHLYLIASGAVRISKRGRGGHQETLSILEEADFFGEMSLYDPDARSARATAVQPSVLGRIDEQGFQQLLEVAPTEISTNLTRHIIKRLRQTNVHFIDEVLQAERLSLVGSMASGIIHDFRNPINVILGATSLLEQSPDPQASARYLGMIRRSVDGMLGMTQELLDYSRGMANLNLAPTSVDELLGDLDEQMLLQLPEFGIQVERQISFGGHMLIDRSRFVRVLVNIVKNAREAMPQGGTLTLSVDLRGDQVVFGIADTGVGIPEKLLSRIFEPFVTHGKASGTGLGMAIAKSVVDAHGGWITVTSIADVGTTFEIGIPAAPEK